MSDTLEFDYGSDAIEWVQDSTDNVVFTGSGQAVRVNARGDVWILATNPAGKKYWEPLHREF